MGMDQVQHAKSDLLARHVIHGPVLLAGGLMGRLPRRTLLAIRRRECDHHSLSSDGRSPSNCYHSKFRGACIFFS